MFHELSDGQRVLFGLYAVLHYAMHEETTVSFDEPDNFVSLREIDPWLQSVGERAAVTKSQVLDRFALGVPGPTCIPSLSRALPEWRKIG